MKPVRWVVFCKSAFSIRRTVKSVQKRSASVYLDAIGNPLVVQMGCQKVLKSLFPVENPHKKRFPAWVVVILSEVAPGMARVGLKRPRTTNSLSIALKWLQGIDDLGERAAPYR